MWKVKYTVLGSDGTLYKNEKQVERLADFHLFNNALHHGQAQIVAVRDPMGRRHHNPQARRGQ